MSEYREFTGKTVEEALREAREAFGAELNDLDFEILTPGSRGVLGMGAEPARIVAAPRSALGGAAPKREAAAATPLPAPTHVERDDHDRPPRRDDRPRGGDRDRGPRRDEQAPSPNGGGTLTASEQAEVAAARGSLASERAELEAAEASPEALAAGKAILEQLMVHLGFDATVEVDSGETSRLNVVGTGDEKEALGALIGRKGERLSALQHLVNLMLSRRTGQWTRVLVDVEDYRGRRERQLVDLATRAAERVTETGKMLQLEPMPALERRWIHLALKANPDVATQSIGEEPNRRIVVHRPLVRPVVGHRVVGVGDRDDAGPQRNVRSAQPERVAVAREPLVVVEDDRDRVAQRRRLLEDDLADPRMLDDCSPLRRRQRRRLLEDLLGHRDLADVVQQRRGPDPVDLDLRQRERPGHRLDDRGDHRRGLAAVVGKRRDSRREGVRGGLAGDPSDLECGRTPVARDRGAGHPGVVVRLGEDVRLVPAERLRRVHRRVGVADKRIAREPRPDAAGDADRDRDRDALAVGVEPLAGDDVAELLGEDRAFLDVRLGEDQHELLAAVAAHHIGRPQVR